MSQPVKEHSEQTSGTVPPGAAERAASRPGLRARLPWARLGWPTAVVVTVVVLAAIPALFHHRFYFSGDTQAGAVGQWYYLGTQLRAGHWPLLDITTWRAGNFAAEGQWGLFSPLTMLIGLATTVVPNLVVFVTVLKTGLLVTGALGTYLLARSYSASRAAAYVGAVAVTMGGATQYLESPSWVTGQMCWALLPWVWWSFRRLALGPANPAPALVSGFLMVTVGYVYGTLFLVFAIVACLLEAAVARRPGGLVRVFVAGALCGLVALTVYLPGMLTASVTTRSSTEILSDGRLQADLVGLLTGMLPNGISPAASSFSVHYLAWFLPVVLWLDLGRVKALVRPMLGAWFMLAVMVAWALGPNQIGPLRWPQRVLPEVTLTVVLVIVVLVSRALVHRPSPGRLGASLLWVLVSGYLVISRFWTAKGVIAVSVLAVVVFLTALWWVVRRHGFGRLAAVVAAAACLVTIVMQHHHMPTPASFDRNMGAHPSDYRAPASTARGDVMILGNAEPVIIAHPRATREEMVASSWFLSDRPVQSVYSTIGFSTYTARFCIYYNGATCADALTRLFTREPVTGERRIDLLSVSTLLLNRKDFRPERLLDPPRGWHVSDEGRWSVTWVRNEPLPHAGGVVWSSDGVDVTKVSASTREVRLRVGPTPAGGGEVVLSRLAWPGYSVTGGKLADPVDDYLLTVRVPASSTSREVTVSFAPPGWAFEVSALVLALVAGVLWSVVAGLRPLRRRSRRSPGHEPLKEVGAP